MLPPIFTTFLYTYTLIHILYVGEPLSNFNLKSPWHVYIHIHAWILSYLYPKKSNCFSCQCCRFFASATYFLPMLLLKLFRFLLVVIFSQVDIINFLSCHFLRVNRCQNIILCLIMKRHVQKQKQRLILFHLLEMMIIFWGLMKIIGNDHGVIQVSKGSILIRLFLAYWGRKVCILKK